MYPFVIFEIRFQFLKFATGDATTTHAWHTIKNNCILAGDIVFQHISIMNACHGGRIVEQHKHLRGTFALQYAIRHAFDNAAVVFTKI